MMKKTNSAKRGFQEGNQQPLQPEKVGWVRKFCGKGIFREIWKNRFVVLKGDQLYISEKELRDEKNTQEVFDLNDYEKCEELRKSKSRSKKNYSKFSLAHSKEPGNTAPNLVFLAVSPEEKESWINVLNSAIIRAKNRILDEVTVEEESFLAHPTRNRAKIQHSRRPPTRGHLMAVASTSTSDGMLTLDLIQEEEASPEDHDTCEKSFRVDLDKSVTHFSPGRRRSDSEKVKDSEKTNSLPRRKNMSGEKFSVHREAFGKGTMYTPQVPKKLSHLEKNKCASMEEILSCWDSSSASQASLRISLKDRTASPEPEQLARIQELVALQLEKTQGLLTEARGYGGEVRKAQEFGFALAAAPACAPSSPKLDSAATLQEIQRLLGEASSSWSQAQKVLQEVRELRSLYQQLRLSRPAPPQSLLLPQYRRSLM
ncbi:pleckstrin homology domain-containing family O member 1 isoform X3 [Pantherophis guttatus]|uniref:Pleckstrin homology domain-containing family O member 1 isoform X3 n=1 Tax=Pantherophis guttatus TaxID=94885 RepID=A0A6P9CDD7_PANGU|nr:pleckstrin homology domain-containing family O member 1 isoform X3 [Pantherophis guttatus]